MLWELHTERACNDRRELLEGGGFDWAPWERTYLCVFAGHDKGNRSIRGTWQTRPRNVRQGCLGVLVALVEGLGDPTPAARALPVHHSPQPLPSANPRACRGYSTRDRTRPKLALLSVQRQPGRSGGGATGLHSQLHIKVKEHSESYSCWKRALGSERCRRGWRCRGEPAPGRTSLPGSVSPAATPRPCLKAPIVDPSSSSATTSPPFHDKSRNKARRSRSSARSSNETPP